MNALVPIGAAGPEIRLAAHPELLEAARDFARASKAPATKLAYAADWAAFSEWCRSKGLQVLPAAPEAVAVYLADLASRGRKVATVMRALASIAAAHNVAGLPSPRSAAPVREVLAGIRRTIGVAQRQVAPILPGDLRRIVAALPAGLLGLRDAALLLLGFAAAARRSELVALEVADLVFSVDGIEVTIRRSKTDQEGRGMKKAIPYGSDPATCPVRRLRQWLDASQIATGPVFRSVDRHGRLGAKALDGRSIARIVKRSARAAGLDEAKFSGHSLRAGLATAAAKAGKSTHSIMRQTGHKSAAMVARYVREAELFSDNAAAGIGL